MPRHNFATAAEVVTPGSAARQGWVCLPDIHCSFGATPDQLRDRVGCAYLIYPVQGVRAAGLQLIPLIYART